MASDYTIIMWVRHRFGVDEASEAFEGTDFVLNEDSNAPFVGLTGEFPFSCPHIDSAQGAVLQFEYRGSSQVDTFPDPLGAPGTAIGITPEYPVKINGQLIAGGVPGAPVRGGLPIWSTRVLLVDRGVLGEENTLRIEASVDDGGLTYQDKFTIDNVVIFFKTKTANPGPDIGPVKG
jgi:hypothetical protein